MKLSEKYLVIAHYHKTGLIRDDLVNLVKNSKKSFDKILFISTKLKISEREKIEKYSKVFVRPNVGYDFYSYKIGIEYLLKRKSYEKKNILLIASSLFYLNPKKIFKEINKVKNVDNKVYTLSKSWEIKEHLQSDMFYFSMSLFKNKFFLRWWKKIRKTKSRQSVIENYELNFLEKLKEFNIKGKTLFVDNINNYPNNLIKKLLQKIKDIFFRKKKIYKKNPTHFYWEKIYKKFGVIKIDLIKTNPHNADLRNLKKYFTKTGLIKLKKEALEN